ncbi:MAG: ABC transporter ATP-binding protein [Chloroflexota bacterium]|nr:MAG: ABC transporter ATP-binding protein [Chloroflexota bacterium]
MLEVNDLNTFYGHVRAIRDVSISVHPGEIVAILGANGAGKSTLLNTIAGMIPPAAGRIALDGLDVTFRRSHELVQRGLILVPERRQLFWPLTVEENLRLGAYRCRTGTRQLGKNLERIYSLFPRLAERRKQGAGTLSGGEQQMVAIGRGLMSQPRLFLLDEPSLGLAPLVRAEIFRALRQLNGEHGLTLLLVEQDTKLALSIANRGYVMQTGQIVLQGQAQSLLANAEVHDIYLGKGPRTDAISITQ